MLLQHNRKVKNILKGCVKGGSKSSLKLILHAELDSIDTNTISKNSRR